MIMRHGTDVTSSGIDENSPDDQSMAEDHGSGYLGMSWPQIIPECLVIITTLQISFRIQSISSLIIHILKNFFVVHTIFEVKTIHKSNY